MEKIDYKKQIDETMLKMAHEPENTANYHELARLYALQGKYDNVVSIYESLLNIHPNDSQAIINLGGVCFYHKDYPKAIEYYEKALKLEPKNYIIYF